MILPTKLIVFLIFICTFGCFLCVQYPEEDAATENGENKRDLVNSRNVTLLGLYTLHEGFLDLLCDTVLPTNIILLMVHEYVVDHVNENVLNGTGIMLKTEILDTCDNATVTLQKIVGAISNSHVFCSPWKDGNKNADLDLLLAATGVFSGEIGANVNYLLRAFCLPVVASGSSSSELDNPVNYPYFMRSGASNAYKAQVIYDILQSQHWYHINVIYDSSSFGVALTTAFNDILNYCDGTDYYDDYMENVFKRPCIENYFQISNVDGNDTLEVQLNDLNRGLNATNTKVLLMLMEDTSIDFILTFLELYGHTDANTQFIFPSRHITESHMLNGALVVEESVEEFDPLDDIVYSMSISNATNKYVIELIEEQNLCCWSNDTACAYSMTCDGSETIQNITMKARHEARHVYNAIMIIASALKAIHDEVCPAGSGVCTDLKDKYTGGLMLQNMLNSTFVDDRGQSFSVFQRAAEPFYNIYFYNESTWQLVSEDYNPYFGATDSDDYYEISQDGKLEDIGLELATCQQDCDKSIPDITSKCCWKCIPCGFAEIINQTLQMCQNCSVSEIPNKALNACIAEPIPPIIYPPTAEMYVLIGFSALGIVASGILAVYIYRKKKTPMVMASTPDLCYLQAATQSLLFVSSFFMLPTSSLYICGIAWTFATTLLLITHAIFLIKAIRLSRPRFYTKLISYTNTPVKSSLVMLSVLSLSQFMVCVIWVLLRPPTIYKTRDHYKYCSSNDEIQTIVLMILPMSLVVGTFYFQKNATKNMIMFQVRQARIGLAGTLCFIVNYVILLPLIFMEESPQYVRSTILMCIPILTAYVSLMTMHLPVAYELFCRNTQNSHEYVSRERSRQFQAGNMVYYVDAMLVNRANRTRTQTRQSNSIT